MTTPFLPSERPRVDPLKNFYRHATALAMCGLGVSPYVDHAIAKLWPDLDKAGVQTVMRAAVAPMTTTSNGVQALGNSAGIEFLRSLRPRSAAAQLFDLAVNLDVATNAQATIPRLIGFPDPVFVGEGMPAPVGMGITSATVLGPVRKMMMLAGITSELANRSAPDAEALIRLVMTETAGHALDVAVLSSADATEIRPAGLLNGVTAITATTGGGTNALAKDTANLVGAIADAGGGTNVVFLMNPRQASAVTILANGFRYPIIDAPSLAAGTIVAVDAAALATGFNGVPAIDLSKEAVLHWEDAAPLPIASAGTPNTVAAPVRSAFQNDLIALRMILPCAWASMLDGGVQYITGATW